MKGSIKVAKGRAKEAAGVLVGNKQLRARGLADQAVGRIKQGTENDIRRAKASARKTMKRVAGR